MSKITKKVLNELIGEIASRYSHVETITSKEIAAVTSEFGHDYLPYPMLKPARVSHGRFSVSELMKVDGLSAPTEVADSPTNSSVPDVAPAIPVVDPVALVVDPVAPVVAPVTPEVYTQKIMDSAQQDLVPAKLSLIHI